MYNEDRKLLYINTSPFSAAQKTFLTKLFSDTAVFETELDKDLSEMEAPDLQRIADKLGGIKKSTWENVISAMRGYVRWCVAAGYPGAHEVFDQLVVNGIEAIRKRMVSGPAHLALVMDKVFSPVSERKIDLVFRGFLWMSFSGLEEEDLYKVVSSDVDFVSMKIRYNGRAYPLYAEAVETFHYLCESTTFVHSHPIHKQDSERPRVEGDTLLRGYTKITATSNFRSNLSREFRRKKDSVHVSLSYNSTWLSGFFYRTYEFEQLHPDLELNLVMAAEKAVGAPESDDAEYLKKRKINITKHLRIVRNDYLRWKVAFGK